MNHPESTDLLELVWGTMLCACEKVSPIRDYDKKEFYFRLEGGSPVIQGTVTGIIYIDDSPIAQFYPVSNGVMAFKFVEKLPDPCPVQVEIEHASPYICLVFNKPVSGKVTATVLYEYPRD